MMDAQGVVIVSGIPGSGKSTVARRIAERFPRSVHIEGDVVGHDFIVSGVVPPEGPPRDEADRQLALRRRNITLLADSFAQEQFLSVIDDVVVSSGVLDEYLEQLIVRPVRFFQLTPKVDVVEARDAGRDKQVFGTWGHLDTVMRGWPPPRPGTWVDTSSLSADDTVDALLAAWESARLP